MYIQVEKQYEIIQPKTNNITIEFDIEEYIKRNNVEINDKSDLEYAIQEWIDYDCNEILYDIDDYENGNISDRFDEVNLILNMGELVKEFSYLIIPEKKETVNCCEVHDTPYCPICGTKLR